MSLLATLGSAGVGSLISAGSNLVSNIFNGFSQRSANKQNLKIAQMNNEWSERMMNKQMDYNTMMWNKQNDYNDPSKQVERLQKAGINPALALSNISTGSAQGVSSPSLPSPTNSTVQAARYDFSGVGEALSTAYQLQTDRSLAIANMNFMDAQADVARARAAADNAWTYEKLKDTRVGRLFLEQTFDLRKKQMNADYYNTLRHGRQMSEQIKLTAAQGLLARKELAIFDDKTAAGLSNMMADTLLKGAQGKLTKQQMIHEVQKMYKTAAEAKGIRISNDVARRSADAIVEKAILDTIPEGGHGLPKAAWWIGNQFDKWLKK